MNLTSIILSLLTPAIVSRIAVALGLPPATVQAAINAVIPAILAILARQTAKGAGADALATVLGLQRPGTLSHLSTLIGGVEQEQLVEGGRKGLESILGAQPTESVAKIIAQFAGLPAPATSGLLGMMAPVVLGALAQQQKATNLDSPRLAALLKAQAPLFAAALPAGLSDLLAASGLIGAPDVGAKPAEQHASPSVAHKTTDMASADLAADALRSAAAAAALSVLKQTPDTPQIVASPPPVASPPAPVQPAPETARLVAEAARKMAAASANKPEPASPQPAAIPQSPANLATRQVAPPAVSDWRWFAPFIVVVLLAFAASVWWQ